MNVTLWNVTKKVNSTFRPAAADGVSFTCDLKDPVNVLYPTLRFSTAGQTPERYNYVHIGKWRRHYWIDEWVCDGNVWEAHCSVDPLASFRNEIGSSTQYVLRTGAEDAADGTIMDIMYPTTGHVTLQKTFANFAVSPDESNGGGCYVVGVIGKNGLVDYYYLSGSELPAFGAAMFGDTLWASVTADDTAPAANLPGFMKAQFNPLQYVVSCLWFPVQVPHASAQTAIKLGYFDTGYNAYRINRAMFPVFSEEITITKHPQASRGKYLNLSPYTRIKLSALPWGEVELDTTKFVGMTKIVLKAWADPVTGTSKLEVGGKDTAGSLLTDICSLMGNIGTPEQLSQVLSNPLGAAAGAVGAATGGVAQLLSGNIGGAIATAISGVVDAAAAIYPDVSSQGQNGARIAACPITIFVLHTFMHVVSDDRTRLGAPYCENTVVSSLPGFMMVANPVVGFSQAMKRESDMIRDYMRTGFYYE